MERLTERGEHGNTYFPQCFEEPCNGTGCTKSDCDFIIQICDRLAAYEDTSLSPEEVATELVRCKDCKHLMRSDFYGECGIGRMAVVTPDYFCSYGQRKDG